MSFGLEPEGGSLITPTALAHPLHPINDRSRNKHRNLWVGWCVSSWRPMFSSRSFVLPYIYLYVCILYTGSGYRMYIYIHRECHSVVVKQHLITVYRAVFLGVRGSSVECHLLFSLVSPFVSYSMIIRLILGCVWPLVSVLNDILTIGILRSVIFHLPGCFCPWTFFQNMGFNMVPSNSFMSHLYTQLGYSTGEVQALQLIVLAAFGVLDQSLASCMLVHFSDIYF